MSATNPAQAEPQPVIIASDVWKRYQQNEHRASLRHEAGALVRRWMKSPPEAEHGIFWALQAVTFTVYKGESVGLIGHNGAGKSTLFRLLAGITEPTRGTVSVSGRFAPLLGLGVGFNPELSGHRNIYLTAAILGLTRREIDRIAPEVIAFSELEAFIDMPIKRYSSGMVSRLGFSIAIHVLPDIIFLDEVLAVGDSAFQEKCRIEILRLKAEKRTIMLVSHNSHMIRALCERAIWLDHGIVKGDGASGEIVERYEQALHTHMEPSASINDQSF
jgi:ABC-type polysaccharide/polyol phosphate transport system ATPase subunit